MDSNMLRKKMFEVSEILLTAFTLYPRKEQLLSKVIEIKKFIKEHSKRSEIKDTVIDTTIRLLEEEGLLEIYSDNVLQRRFSGNEVKSAYEKVFEQQIMKAVENLDQETEQVLMGIASNWARKKLTDVVKVAIRDKVGEALYQNFASNSTTRSACQDNETQKSSPMVYSPSNKNTANLQQAPDTTKSNHNLSDSQKTNNTNSAKLANSPGINTGTSTTNSQQNCQPVPQKTPDAKISQSQPTAKPREVSQASPANNAKISSAGSGKFAITEPPVQLGTWKYLPVPNEPDPHDEFAIENIAAGQGFRIIGARARGKMHKHNGTNCDDWFEFCRAGNWNLIAVSDGAGSAKFSRVGAKASCCAAIDTLKEKLEQFFLAKRSADEWFKDSGILERDANWVFKKQDFAQVQSFLHDAMKNAYNALEAAFQERESIAEYKTLLGRELSINDFSCTLLLAVQTTVEIQGILYSFYMTCQVGDGISAAIIRSRNGDLHLQLLGEPDGGEFSGQTYFLTSKSKLEIASLRQKTFAQFGNLQALFTMTDGVADDYFPADPDLLRLFADLCMNRILEISEPEKQEPEQAARLISVDFSTSQEQVTKDGPKTVQLLSAGSLCKKMPIELKELVKDYSLLSYISHKDTMQGVTSSEQRLLYWLDSYFVRGSNDDRTIVILAPEKL